MLKVVRNLMFYVEYILKNLKMKIYHQILAKRMKSRRRRKRRNRNYWKRISNKNWKKKKKVSRGNELEFLEKLEEG